MPKSTFFNLPAAKRDRIVELAIESFSERPYGQASLSKIVSKAGIAKGSIYQYFEHKLDLYRWLVLDYVGSRQLKFIDAQRGQATEELFDQLEAMAMGTIRFFVAEPRLARMSMRLHEPATDPELQSLHEEVRRRHHEWMTEMFKAAQREGRLSDEIEPAMAAHLASALMGPGLVDALLGSLGVTLPELLADPSITERVTEDDQRTLARAAVGMLRAGMSSGTGASRREVAFSSDRYSDIDLPAE